MITSPRLVSPRERVVPWLDALLLAAFALAIRLPALFSHRHHNPDDGFYGMSAVVMRDGALPFRDVFSSQGPLHLTLVFVGDLPRAAWSPRVAATVAGIAVTVLVYLIGRRIATRPLAVLAALLVTTSGSILWTTAPATSDGPTVACVCAALLLALLYEERPGPGRAAAVGAAVAAAILIKTALGALGALPAVWIVARARRPRDTAVAALTAIVAGLAASTPFGLTRVWDQAVSYQLQSGREQSVGANLRKVFDTLLDRDLAVIVVLAVALVGTAVWRGRSREPASRPGITALLLLWALPIFVFLVLEPALWRNHLAALIVPSTLLAVTRPVPTAWLVTAAVVVAPFQLAHVNDILLPPDYSSAERSAVGVMRSFPRDAQIISDEPGLVWRAGRRAPDDFVDTSIKQIEQGRITARSLVEASSRPEVCGVLVWRSTHFGSLPGLADGLAAQGYEATTRFAPAGSGRVLFCA